jgi:hypothetical protein
MSLRAIAVPESLHAWSSSVDGPVVVSAEEAGSKTRSTVDRTAGPGPSMPRFPGPSGTMAAGSALRSGGQREQHRQYR